MTGNVAVGDGAPAEALAPYGTPLATGAAGVETEGTKLAGAELLGAVAEYVDRYVALPSTDALVAVVLWVVHTHLADCWDSTPRLAFMSAEPASGKTRALEVISFLVPRPFRFINATAAAMVRTVANQLTRPTVLIDEIDTIFGPRARGNEELRALLNAGHRRGATIPRCAPGGPAAGVVELPVYAAAAMAGLGTLPDTLVQRSVVIRMRPRAPREKIERFTRRDEPAGRALAEQLASWATAVRERASAGQPLVPEGLSDRAEDVWEPLLVVADLAGGEWPERARRGAVALVADSAQSTTSRGRTLLADVRTLFTSTGAEQLPTEELVVKLRLMTERPWDALMINPRWIAVELAQYEISPRRLRSGQQTMRGYRRVDFTDAWNRYCPKPDLQAEKSTT